MDISWGKLTSVLFSLSLAVTVTACFQGPAVTTEEPEPAGHAEVAIDHVEAEPAAAPTGTGTNESSTTSTTKPRPSTSTTSTTEAEDDDEDTDDVDEDAADEDSSNPGQGNPPGSPGVGNGHVADSVAYVNERRRAEGAGSLEVDPDLTAMAENWTRQMIAEQDLYHNPNLGQQRPDRFRTIGENIAYSSNPANINDMWWNSDGHRANILNASYTHVGIAFIQDDRGVTWATQVFAG